MVNPAPCVECGVRETSDLEGVELFGSPYHNRRRYAHFMTAYRSGERTDKEVLHHIRLRSGSSVITYRRYSFHPIESGKLNARNNAAGSPVEGHIERSGCNVTQSVGCGRTNRCHPLEAHLCIAVSAAGMFPVLISAVARSFTKGTRKLRIVTKHTRAALLRILVTTANNPRKTILIFGKDPDFKVSFTRVDYTANSPSIRKRTDVD